MLDRRHAVKLLLAERGDTLVVCGLGSPTYNVAAAGDDRTFILAGLEPGLLLGGGPANGPVLGPWQALQVVTPRCTPVTS